MSISLIKAFRGLYRLCQCNCGELIPCINTGGKLGRFKHGHNDSGGVHPKGIKSVRWKGGKSNQGEYNLIYKPFFKYSHKTGYVLEHRYIMYIYLSILNNKPTYIEGFDVHHKNTNKKDNRIENLEILTRSDHTKISITMNIAIGFQRIDMSNRFCNICGNNETRISKRKNGKYQENWHNDIIGFLCDWCYDYIRRYEKKLRI